MSEDKEIEKRLEDIEKKLGEKKKDVWEIVSIISTILTPVLLAVLGYYFSVRANAEELRQTAQQSERNELFKKSELLEKFGPYLYDSSALKNKIAIIGMYTIDTSFALQLATIINSAGTQSAIKALFRSADSVEQSTLERVLVKTQEKDSPVFIDSLTPGGKALINALQELQAGAKEIPANSNTGPFVKKYFSAVGIDIAAPWSTAFVVWCYLSDPSLAPRLSFMKTASPNELYNRMKQKGMILSPAQTPRAGDIVFVQRQVSGVLHCGLIQSVENDLFYTIEGNVSMGGGEDGGRVLKRVVRKEMIYAIGSIK